MRRCGARSGDERRSGEVLGGLLIRGRILGRAGTVRRARMWRAGVRCRGRRIALRHQRIECRGRGSVMRGAEVVLRNCCRHHVRRWTVVRRGRRVPVVSRLSFIYRRFRGARGHLSVPARYVFARRFLQTGVGCGRRIMLRDSGIGASGCAERGDIHLCGVLQPRRSCRHVGIVETQSTAPCCTIETPGHSSSISPNCPTPRRAHGAGDIAGPVLHTACTDYRPTGGSPDVLDWRCRRLWVLSATTGEKKSRGGTWLPRFRAPGTLPL